MKMGSGRPGAGVQELCGPLRASGAAENGRGSQGLLGLGPWLGAAASGDGKALV